MCNPLHTGSAAPAGTLVSEFAGLRCKQVTYLENQAAKWN